MRRHFPFHKRHGRTTARASRSAAAAGALLLIHTSAAHAQFNPIRPPSIPLITRTPYVSEWLQSTQAPGNWPGFWRSATMALTLMASVDGQSYVLMGAPGGAPNATQTNLQITPTQSIFTFQAGAVSVTADFLSPVEATDLQRLSMPLGNITLQAHSTDGATHHVRFYCDITGEWAHGDSNTLIRWNPETISRNADGSGTAGSLLAWEATPNSPAVLTEVNEYPAWGTQVIATASQTGLTSQSGPANTVRAQFVSAGALTNGNDTNQPRAINNNWPTFAFSQDLGSIGAATSAPFTVLIGHPTNPAVSFHYQNLPPLWLSYWTNYQAMFAFACNDSPSAQARANAFDQRITQAATQIGGTNYAALCALSLRQAYAGTEMVGTSANPMMFLKEISSAGDVSTVDVIYPGLPAYLYTNPTIVRLLLEPIISYSEMINPATNRPYFDHPFALHDLGGKYPNGTGHDSGSADQNEETMPVEESANMLIMADAYMKYNFDKSVSTSYAQQHYAIFKKWADYLLTVPAGVTTPNALDPQAQLSTDDFLGVTVHDTNLALKAILALGAMGQIASQAGNTADASYYTQQAQQLIGQWAAMAGSTDGTHLLLQYREAPTSYTPPAPGEPSSCPDTRSEADSAWSMKYNAFPDKMLGLNLIPTAVLAKEAALYRTKEYGYGVPLNSSVLSYTFNNGYPNGPLAKLDWELWAAAGMDDTSLRQDIINEVFQYANTTPDLVPFDDDYNPATDHKGGFVARSVVGGVFAPLVRAAGAFPNPAISYKLVNAYNNLLAGINGASTSTGAPLIQWSDNGTLDHLWQFSPYGTGYKALNRNSGKVAVPLDDNPNNYSWIVQWDDNGSSDHGWRLLPNLDGSYRIENTLTNKVLTVTDWSTTLGQTLTQWDDNGTVDHNWFFWPVF